MMLIGNVHGNYPWAVQYISCTISHFRFVLSISFFNQYEPHAYVHAINLTNWDNVKMLHYKCVEFDDIRNGLFNVSTLNELILIQKLYFNCCGFVFRPTI
jgi:hypothetical protein